MQRRFKTYLALFAGLFAVLAAITMTFNWWVDPFFIHRAPPENGLLTGIGPYTRIVKPYLIEAREPHILLAGSSRAEYALDPHAASSLLGGAAAFNAALSSANIYELRRLVDHANAAGAVRVVVMGIDFFMFNRALKNRAPFSDDRLLVRPDGTANPWRVFADLPATLLSVDALDASRRKLKYAGRYGSCDEVWRLDGFYHSHRFNCAAATNGAFRANIQATLGAYLSQNELYGRYVYAPEKMKEITTLLWRAKEKNQRVILYLSPVHALHLAAIKRAGLWPEFENWKRSLLREVEEAKARGANAALWDFARLNGLTSIPLPPENDEPWNGPFYDSHHIRPEMGNRMLQQMLNAKGAPSWGVRLAAGNVEAELARQKKALAAWLAAHPEEAAFLEMAGP